MVEPGGCEGQGLRVGFVLIVTHRYRHVSGDTTKGDQSVVLRLWSLAHHDLCGFL